MSGNTKSGEKEFFRKRFFGGFNREDVVKYLAKIANERNEALAAQEKADENARLLTEENKKLREEKEELINVVAEKDILIKAAAKRDNAAKKETTTERAAPAATSAAADTGAAERSIPEERSAAANIHKQTGAAGEARRGPSNNTAKRSNATRVKIKRRRN